MTQTVNQDKFRGGTSTVVGLLACQLNSYQQTLETKVVSCAPWKEQPATVEDAKKNKKKKDQKTPASEQPVAKELFELELEDTVLFPEGGGQPSDSGILIASIDGEQREINVSSVRRDGLTALHLVEVPLEPATKVTAKINWAKRLDHMQQHTGQHLLSAILDKREVPTLGWNMGEKFNYVELNRKLSQEEVDSVQAEVDAAILGGTGIKVEIPEDEEVEHKAPEDYDTEKGVIRVVHIGQLDSNPCCGTHLQSTSEIGALSLFHQQAIRGTNSRLFFMAGGRVTAFARSANDSLRRINAALSCQTEDIDDKISRLNSQLREANNKEKYWSAESARHEANSIKSLLANGAKVVFSYSPKGTMDYFKTIERELGDISGTIVLVGGDIKEAGMIIVAGADVADVAKRVVSQVPNARGGGKGKWQGKVPLWEKNSLDTLLEEFKECTI